jgi:hypothetical protein
MQHRYSALVAALACIAAASCSSSSSHTSSPKQTSSPTSNAATTTPTTVPATPDTQVWLCKPGNAVDPCTSDLTATIVTGNGTRTKQRATVAADPKIDCFYVYPTVSLQPTMNANLHIDPAETEVAIAQASRYSQACRVFAPMYRQLTITALGGGGTRADGAIAFSDVLSAWKDYLARYNDGRGVVLIGHSQGSGMLRTLISKYIDPNPAVRDRVVSAILLGGNVLVPKGKLVGGDFQHLPACQSASQTGCVIAYSSFDMAPPANSIFARSRNAQDEVLCTNPANLAGGSGVVTPYFVSRGGLFNVAGDPTAKTPWVTYPNLYTARCVNANGADALMITDVRKAGDARPKLHDSLGPTWGLHLYDGQIALGNLVDIVRSEANAYTASH